MLQIIKDCLPQIWTPYPAWPFKKKLVPCWQNGCFDAKRLAGQLCRDHHTRTDADRILITGIGGLGKTFCAKGAFQSPEVRKVFANRRFYLDFSGAVQPTDVVRLAIESLPAVKNEHGDCEADVQQIVQTFLDRLDASYGRQRVLVVLDGLNRLAHIDVTFLDRLLSIARSTTPERRHSVVALSRCESTFGVVWTEKVTPFTWQTDLSLWLHDACKQAGIRMFDGGPGRTLQQLLLHSGNHPLCARLLLSRIIEANGDLQAVLHRLRLEGPSYLSLPPNQRSGDRFDSLAACLDPTWEALRGSDARRLWIDMAVQGCTPTRAAQSDEQLRPGLQALRDHNLLWPGRKVAALHPVAALYALEKQGGHWQAASEANGWNDEGLKREPEMQPF